jgi:protein-S-isoprenylcysteine O-methyltransferase Ste14
MMLEELGDQYAAYTAKAKQLVPGLWCLIACVSLAFHL